MFIAQGTMKYSLAHSWASEHFAPSELVLKIDSNYKHFAATRLDIGDVAALAHFRLASNPLPA